MQVAIDAGHGWVKGLSSRGDRTIFPALIHPAPSTLDLGAFAHPPVTQIDDQPYLVGEAAQRVAAPLWSRDKAVDEATLQLILVAAAMLGAIGPVRLATGLPLGWFGSQHQALKAALRDYSQTVVLPDGTKTHLWFESVLVLPQGVAAAGPVLDQAHYAPGPYVVVDIGYRTTDYVVVTKQAGGALTFDAMAAGSLELGMHAVAVALANQLTLTHQIPFTAAQVAMADSVIVRGQRYPLQNLRQAQERQVARSIVQGLMERLDHQLDQVLGLVAVGGGSSLLTQAVPEVIQPDHPQWANAQGYLAALAMTTDRLLQSSPSVGTHSS